MLLSRYPEPDFSGSPVWQEMSLWLSAAAQAAATGKNEKRIRPQEERMIAMFHQMAVLGSGETLAMTMDRCRDSCALATYELPLGPILLFFTAATLVLLCVSLFRCLGNSVPYDEWAAHQRRKRTRHTERRDAPFLTRRKHTCPSFAAGRLPASH